MSKVIYRNPDFILMTEELGARYAQAKLNTSWGYSRFGLPGQPGFSPEVWHPVRQAMDDLHRAWPSNSVYADADFPQLLDVFDAAWKPIFEKMVQDVQR